jgi:hypothetical protein
MIQRWDGSRLNPFSDDDKHEYSRLLQEMGLFKKKRVVSSERKGLI